MNLRSANPLAVFCLVGALGALVTPGCNNDKTPEVSGPILRGSGGHAASAGKGGQAGVAGSHAGVGGSGKGTGGSSAGGTSGEGSGAHGGAEHGGGRGGSGGTGIVVEPGGAGAGAGEAGEGGARPAGSGGTGGQAGQGAGAGEAGAGGTPGTEQHVFQTITALYDAIEGAALANGDSWSVTWSSDAYVGAGSISGTLAGGQPSPSVLDQGPLPLKLFAASDFTAYSNESGTVQFDSNGYPGIELGANADATDYQALSLSVSRYGFRRFTRANMRIAQDLTGASDLSGVSFRLADAGQQNFLIANDFVEVGGATMSVAFDYVTSGTQTLTNGQPATSTRVFDGIWSLLPASPTSATLSMTMELESLAAAELGTDSAEVAGQGDWSTDSGLAYAPVFGLYRATGGTGTSSATAITFEVDRYQP